MVLTIDIGNTATKVAAMASGKPLEMVKVEGQKPQDIRKAIEEVRRKAKAHQSLKVEGAAVSSTIGYSDELKDALSDFNTIYVDNTTSIPIENCYATPRTLGSDRLCAVIGAHHLCPSKDALVIDAGTAITYDYVTAEGRYLGGNIAPGISLRFLSLKEHTAKLPLVSAEGETPLFGNSTETAIRAGVIQGVKYEIEGYIREIMSKNSNVSVFLTGGSAINFEDSIKRCTFADSFLVHKGLYAIYKHNFPIDNTI